MIGWGIFEILHLVFEVQEIDPNCWCLIFVCTVLKHMCVSGHSTYLRVTHMNFSLNKTRRYTRTGLSIDFDTEYL